MICEIGDHESDKTFLTWAPTCARRGDVSAVTEEDRPGRSRVQGSGTISSTRRSRRRALGDDLISALVEVEDETGRLSDEEVVSTCVILLQAGHETTADLISMAIRGLLLHPDQLALLRREPARVAPAADEFIRWDTSVQISQRVGSRDVEVAGRRIPAGDVFVVMNGAANRDPARFPDPDRLDIERATASHLGFGMGRHFCLGASLARAEIGIAVGTFLRRFPRFAFAEDPSP